MALIAQWKFDNNFIDTIGGYNGTNTGATFVTGKIEQAVNVTNTQKIITSSISGWGTLTQVYIESNGILNASQIIEE